MTGDEMGVPSSCIFTTKTTHGSPFHGHLEDNVFCFAFNSDDVITCASVSLLLVRRGVLKWLELVRYPLM